MAERLTALQTELLAQRDRYNTMFALAKRARPRLDPECFSRELIEYLAPVVAETDSLSLGRLVPELYELTLELSALEVFTRSLAVRELWTTLLPRAARSLVDKPASVVASLSNAIYNLEREPNCDWRYWLSKMLHVIDSTESADQWLKAAQVLAWVSGMAHYRESACQIASSLPSAVVESLVPRWDKVSHDPWWSRRSGEGSIQKVHQIGEFLGFGGCFRRPPELISAGTNRFLVSDGTDDWLLFCDGFGATLKRVVNFEIPKTSPATIEVSRSGTIEWAGVRLVAPELEPVTSFDASGEVLAVCTELSHQVHLFLLSEAQ